MAQKGRRKRKPNYATGIAKAAIALAALGGSFYAYQHTRTETRQQMPYRGSEYKFSNSEAS